MNKLHELAELKQAVWLDTISRSMLRNGGLQKRIDDGVRGVTSNPSIFKKAIVDSDDYDADISRFSAEGKTLNGIYEALVLEDIGQAADLLRPLYDATDALDGYVSLEVSPKLANDTDGTIRDANRLFKALNRPNVLIKIPATPAGLPAIEEAIACGVNVNVTLIFSQNQYEGAAKAYLAGLTRRLENGEDLSHVASVASLFVSRVDTAVDAELERVGNKVLMGRMAIDNARLVYDRFKCIFSGPEWRALVQAGARVQRPLWASTGTKNPDYSDTIYVDSLVVPDTVNTVPAATLDAFVEHGKTELAFEPDPTGARQRVEQLAELGIDLDAVMDKLMKDGVGLFAASFDELMSGIAKKMNNLDKNL